MLSVLRAGARIHVDPNALGQRWFWYDYPNWEPSTFRVFERFVSDDSIVLDVGAWIGPTCLWFAHKARHTVCLEPTQVAFDALRSHLQQNMAYLRPDAVHLVNAALGDIKQTALMTNRGDSMDQLALTRRRLSMIRGNLVNVTTISELERTHPFLSRATFVKVDTEGFERRIMPSLEDSDWLARCKPVLLLSLHPMYTSTHNLERAVNATRNVFPYVWETDMRSPFDFVKHRHNSYRGMEHGGISLVGSWQQLTMKPEHRRV
jgi:FkbM family methyltransferase